MVKDREAWRTSVHGSQRVRATEQLNNSRQRGYLSCICSLIQLCLTLCDPRAAAHLFSCPPPSTRALLKLKIQLLDRGESQRAVVLKTTCVLSYYACTSTISDYLDILRQNSLEFYSQKPLSRHSHQVLPDNSTASTRHHFPLVVLGCGGGTKLESVAFVFFNRTF